jgi:hypothetical protein
MPVRNGRDSNGPFYRWGNSGKKYYYKPNNEKSRDMAKEKAKKQGIAIHASGWKGK